MVEPDQSPGADLELHRPAARRRAGRSGRRSTPSCSSWSAQHRSTIVFVNNRRGAERLALRLNELAGEEIARAHHGSLAREERTVVEEMLKAGELPCLVATSSLELGIDMGAVDLVLQVESPKSVARGLQRIGRAGHSVGDTSKGRIFPKFRADLLECAVVVKLMREGAHRADRRAAQRARRARPADRRDRRVGRATRRRRASTSCTRSSRARTPTPSCPRDLLENVLDMLDGRYPVARVRRAAPAHRVGPRRRHDPRAQGRAPARGDQRRARSPTAACSPSCCPTAAASASSTRRWSTRRAPGRRSCSAPRRGGSRRSGATASSSRPRPACPGAVPFWKGDSVGRPKELGREIGAFSRWAVDQPAEVLERDYDLDALAARNLARLPARAAGRDARGARATARSSSSASATRSATGGCASCRPTAGASTPPGGSRCRARIRDELRPRVRRDLVRRRDHRPPPRRRRAAGRRPRARRPRRARGRRRRRARRQRAVRRALPRERRALAAHPARLPRQAHAAVAAAAEVAVAARGRPALRASSRSSSRPTASACATCSTCRA